WKAITDEDKERLKWWGIFFRKPTPGFFMMRVRMPNGITNALQFRTIAQISTEFGKGFADITTRQQIQLRNMTIEQVPEILKRLKDVGLTTLQTGMDNIRNVVGCSVAGLHAGEVFDASPVVEEFTKTFVGNREFTDLPRKFNPTISGCPDNCTHADTQDLAMVPAEKEISGECFLGFNVMGGGKMGSGGLRLGTPFDIFVTPQEAAKVAAEIIRIFRDHGSREARNKSRLAFLIDEWGVEKFRNTLEERLGHSLATAGVDLRKPVRSDHVGIYRQKQAGLNYVGLKIPVGRLTADHFHQFADLSEKYGSGEIRLTIDQNLILTHIPDAQLGSLIEEPILKTFSYAPSEVMRGLVACTGREFCGLALIETKQIALEVARSLESKISKTEPISMHWSGCPSACGNHLAADLGFQGAKTKVAGKISDATHVFFKGEKILDAVPLEKVTNLLEVMVPHLVRTGRKALRETPREIGDSNSPPPVIGGQKVLVDGKSIAVFEVGTELYGVDAVCPHEGGPLEQGVVEKGCVTCPWHNYKFNLKTGICVNEPSLKVATYPVEKTDAGLVIKKEES
ncbi:MAG: nitrite reductase (NAD(P)H) small subunit, partial [Deltaproteobacteria bacterium]|nr:nitrite reductase (NAD(P)H) small subunit [Deltaproteobacteria bacterium]